MGRYSIRKLYIGEMVSKFFIGKKYREVKSILGKFFWQNISRGKKYIGKNVSGGEKYIEKILYWEKIYREGKKKY